MKRILLLLAAINVEIYDVHGRLRESFVTNTAQTLYSIPAHELENGMYLLRIRGIESTSAVKFVLNH